MPSASTAASYFHQRTGKTEGNLWGVDGNGLVPHTEVRQRIRHLMQFPLATPSGDRDLESDSVGVGENETRCLCAGIRFLYPLGDTVKFNYVFSSEEYLILPAANSTMHSFFIQRPRHRGPAEYRFDTGFIGPVTINNISDDLNCALFPAILREQLRNTLFTHNGTYHDIYRDLKS